MGSKLVELGGENRARPETGSRHIDPGLLVRYAGRSVGPRYRRIRSARAGGRGYGLYRVGPQGRAARYARSSNLVTGFVVDDFQQKIVNDEKR